MNFLNSHIELTNPVLTFVSALTFVSELSHFQLQHKYTAYFWIPKTLNYSKICPCPLLYLLFSPSASFLSPFALFSFSPCWAVTDCSEWTVSLLRSQTINQLCTVSSGWLSQSDSSGWWGWCHQGTSESISVLHKSVGRCTSETVTWTPSVAGCYLNTWR